ncbi:MAG: RdgB/HAM1 family non-canonical purine NTP pyrophosphatase [Nitrospinae bacterium]|nr:RdgB/HAM1 family non-canonical purine NTP pyrophosphatase [Nitrospinota bacterium]
MAQPLNWKNLTFATGNPNKVREAHEILGVKIEHASLDLHEIQTCDLREVVTAKAHQAWEELGVPVMVEDSGLIFSSWNGLPGALVKWFEQTVGCEGMLKMLAGFDNREASAVCMVAVHDGSKIRIAEGRVEGSISTEPRGQNGFGWDIIFIPEGQTRTYAEMSAEEKNAISHRRQAFEELKKMF